MKKLLTNFLPIFVIFITTLALFITNYVPGTYLTGWDNLHPEFNFGANFGRSIFAVWQEYQGTGLLGGMGHAADLLHQLVLFGLSFIVPSSLLRYFWVFLMLFLGSTGAYFLSKKVIFENIKHDTKIFSLISGLFYLLNLATIQMFYAPFEAFIAHFAALPWLLLSSIMYLWRPNFKNLLFLSLILILATPSAYIPTLFLVFVIALLVYIVIQLLLTDKKFLLVKNAGKLFGAITVINSFWLFPFLYFTLTSSQVTVLSKINQMATNQIFEQNKAFGTLLDAMLLKGFWFNNVDPNLAGNFSYMLEPWRNYFSNPLASISGLALFALILAGVVLAVIKKNKHALSFAAIFLFAFTMLATITPPFSWLDTLFRFIPLFNQAFRFPFTKFAILTALSYSVFAGFGAYYLFDFLNRRGKALSFGVLGLVFILIIATSFPVLGGNLLYQKERLEIPDEYFKTFEFFGKQDQNTRIANLPQYTFWGWNFYKWGYGGSGFLWYGIKQPILDRAFDVWSKTSENYYYELSDAIYSRNPKQLENVLNKYQVNWVMVDKNIINPSSPRTLSYDATDNLLKELPNVKQVKTFGNIQIYSVDLRDKVKNFVYGTLSLKSISQPFWKTEDFAYASSQNYKTGNLNNTFYPFGSLFTLKSAKSEDFSISENKNAIVFSKNIEGATGKVNIPSYSAAETILPVRLILKNDSSGNSILVARMETPRVFIDNVKVGGGTFDLPLFSVPKDQKLSLKINLNGISEFPVKLPVGKETEIASTFFLLKDDNQIVLSNSDLNKSITLSPSTLEGLVNEKPEANVPEGAKHIKIIVPKITDPYLSFVPDLYDSKTLACDTFKKGQIETKKELLNGEKTVLLRSSNTTACTYYYNPNMFHDLSYAVFVKSQNIEGQNLHFWALNEDSKYAPIDAYLMDQMSQIIIPPMEQFGRGYSFHIDNVSVSQDSQNRLERIASYPIPYNFITGINLGQDINSQNKTSGINSKHPNESLYIMDRPNSNTIVLSQSYDKGWKMYEVGKDNLFAQAFPFIAGKEVKNHFTVNGWENGWEINSKINENSKLIIVYLPQYLEYAGFALLLGWCPVALLMRKRLN